MGKTRKQRCPECARKQAKIRRLEQEVEELKAELATSGKNSRNSSKPPSSDIVKPQPKRQPGKRKRGGQPGHPKHERNPYSADEIDNQWVHFYEGCPCCGGVLEIIEESATTVQQVDIRPQSIRVDEHFRLVQRCVTCDRVHRVQWPDDLRKAGLVGPRLTALVGYLKVACHMSFSSIRKFLRDCVGVTISRGQLRKVVAKVGDSLLDPYEQLVAMLPDENKLNVDETGHKENGDRLWTWCFRANLYTVYKISPSRGSNVLVEMLGTEFKGVLGCDYFSAYRKYMKDCNVVVQFCLAHFIRDLKFLAEHPNKKNREHGERLLHHFRKLFGIIHRRDEYATVAGFRRALSRVRTDFAFDVIMKSPKTREAENIAERLCCHFESFFTFITTPGIDPTNNLAEQAIRFVAIHRKFTQGTRSKAGRDTCERIWTAVTTCEQQKRSLFHYLCETVISYFKSTPTPSLVPTPDTS